MILPQPPAAGASRASFSTYSAIGSAASPDTLRRLIEAMAASGATPRALAPPAVMRAYQGERPPAVGAGGAALRAALAPQLGHRRFQRPCEPDRARRRARRRGHRPQSAARAVCRPRRGRQPLRPQQPAVPQSALYRRRGDPRICRRRRACDGDRSVARERAGRLCARRRGEIARSAAGASSVPRRRASARAPRRFRILPKRAGRSAAALCLL